MSIAWVWFGSGVAFALTTAFLVIFWIYAPALVDLDVAGGKPPSQATRLLAIAQIRQASLWVAGGLIAIVTLWLTYRRDRVSRDRLDLDRDANFTTRYTQAIAQLGDTSSLAIRLGGVYALERLAGESMQDRQTIVDVLAAFLREKSVAPPRGVKQPIHAAITGDIHAAAVALGRITSARRPTQPTDLRGANLAGARLIGADFSEALLEGASFSGSDLRGATFNDAVIVDTDFGGADLRDAQFIATVIHDANFFEANLVGTQFTNAKFEGINDFYKSNSDATTIFAGSNRGPQPPESGE